MWNSLVLHVLVRPATFTWKANNKDSDWWLWMLHMCKLSVAGHDSTVKFESEISISLIYRNMSECTARNFRCICSIVCDQRPHRGTTDTLVNIGKLEWQKKKILTVMILYKYCTFSGFLLIACNVLFYKLRITPPLAKNVFQHYLSAFDLLTYVIDCEIASWESMKNCVPVWSVDLWIGFSHKGRFHARISGPYYRRREWMDAWMER